MYGDIPYKFKYMLDKIVNCILDYIVKNLNNKPLIETKFLLINNYILDIFHNPETTRNIINNRKLQKLSNSSSYCDKTIMPEFDKNVTLSKFNNVFLKIKINEKNSNDNNRSISPNKDKSKITKLKKLLKDEQEKNMIKELSYLKHLSLFQEKLNYYESRMNKRDGYIKMKENNKNISSTFIKEDKKIKEKMKNIHIDKLNYLTMMNSCKNQKKNFFKNDHLPNTFRIVKHSLSQSKFNDKVIKKQDLDKTKSPKYFDCEEKMIELL